MKVLVKREWLNSVSALMETLKVTECEVGVYDSGDGKLELRCIEKDGKIVPIETESDYEAVYKEAAAPAPEAAPAPAPAPEKPKAEKPAEKPATAKKVKIEEESAETPE